MCGLNVPSRHSRQKRILMGVWKLGHPPSNLENLSFHRAKTVVQCILQGSLPDPGPFVQLLLLTKVTDKIFIEQASGVKRYQKD